MPYLISVQDRHGRIHLREEELGAAFNELMGQEIGSSGVMGGRLRRAPIICVTILQHHGRKICLFLRLSELGDDFGSAALGAFLLRNGIVGARQPGLTAVSTWLTTIAPDLSNACQVVSYSQSQTDSSYLTTMASVTSTLCWDGHVGNTFEVEEKGRCSLGRSSSTIMTIRILISWEDDVDMIHSEKAY